MEKLINNEHLSNIKFAADCAIKEPDSIYSQEFFMLLDETFVSKGDYESPTQAVAVAWLINRVNELEQRAEAAEARASNLNDGWLNAIEERDKARAKLVELAQQKPIGWLNDPYLGRGVIDGEVGEDDFGPGYIPIYRHPFNDVPAPAADLAELVPPERNKWEVLTKRVTTSTTWNLRISTRWVRMKDSTCAAPPSCATLRRRND